MTNIIKTTSAKGIKRNIQKSPVPPLAAASAGAPEAVLAVSWANNNSGNISPSGDSRITKAVTKHK